MTSKSEPPAPPPCERMKEEFHFEPHYWCATHHRPLISCAEIAELRAENKRVTSALRLIFPVGITFESWPTPSRYAFDKARAALAPKEGTP